MMMCDDDVEETTNCFRSPQTLQCPFWVPTKKAHPIWLLSTSDLAELVFVWEFAHFVLRTISDDLALLGRKNVKIEHQFNSIIFHSTNDLPHNPQRIIKKAGGVKHRNTIPHRSIICKNRRKQERKRYERKESERIMGWQSGSSVQCNTYWVDEIMH